MENNKYIIRRFKERTVVKLLGGQAYIKHVGRFEGSFYKTLTCKYHICKAFLAAKGRPTRYQEAGHVLSDLCIVDGLELYGLLWSSFHFLKHSSL